MNLPGHSVIASLSDHRRTFLRRERTLRRRAFARRWGYRLAIPLGIVAAYALVALMAFPVEAWHAARDFVTALVAR